MAAESDWQRYTPWGATPNTLASAATLAPGLFLTVLTGNMAITAITASCYESTYALHRVRWNCGYHCWKQHR